MVEEEEEEEVEEEERRRMVVVVGVVVVVVRVRVKWKGRCATRMVKLCRTKRSLLVLISGGNENVEFVLKKINQPFCHCSAPGPHKNRLWPPSVFAANR